MSEEQTEQPTIVTCPKCGAAIEHYEHIGTEDNRVCPECKQTI